MIVSKKDTIIFETILRLEAILKKIGFIGAGKVGTSFGAYLRKNQFDIAGYFSRTKESAEKAAEYTSTRTFDEQRSLVECADLIFITTSDDQIQKAAESIAKAFDDLSGKSFVHMSGALSTEALASLESKGAAVFSAHPIQAFADIDSAVLALKTSVFGLEGESDLSPLTEIFKATDNKYITLKPHQKSRYHAIACIVSNYLVTLMDFGLEMFNKIGIEERAGVEAMLPMILGTINNIHELGPAEALTGPIARGDVNTIERHLESFTSDETADKDFYKLLGVKTVELASKKKLSDPTKIAELLKILE